MFFQQPEPKGPRSIRRAGAIKGGLQHRRAIDCIPASSRCRVFTIHRSEYLL